MLTNAAGKPDADEVRRIVDLALSRGIMTFDTAPVYRSEAVLGSALGDRAANARLVTKTAATTSDSIDDAGVAAVITAFERSLSELGVPAVAGLLVHHGRELTHPGGELLAGAMRGLRNRGLAERIGFSVYDPSELEAARKVLEPEIVQVPLNLVDQRFLGCGAIEQLASDGVEVLVRSVFLQGALLASPSELPAHLAELAPVADRLEAIAGEAGLSRLVAPLSFCLAVPGVSTVLVGVNTGRELEGVLDAAGHEIALDPSEFARDETAMIDPRLWP